MSEGGFSMEAPQPIGRDVIALQGKALPKSYDERQTLRIMGEMGISPEQNKQEAEIKSPDSKEIIQSEKIDQRDGFSRALEMMQENGTDKQTLLVYSNILSVILLNRDRLNTASAGIVETLGENNPISDLLKVWKDPRLEISGMPIVGVNNNPKTPSLNLEANYRNGEEWRTIVCIDDPAIRNESGSRIQKYKPNGELNTAWSVEINPGDENNPGNMYSKFPGKEKQLLTPVLRQRIDDAFQACKEYSEGVEKTGLLQGYVSPDILPDFTYRDGKKLNIQEIRQGDLYKKILRGDIIRSSKNK